MKEIAIDGPAGAGKSTLAKALSKELNYKYLDTGAMYRACAYFMLNNEVDLEDTKMVNSMLSKMNMRIYYLENEQRVEINNKDITPYLRSSKIANGASAVGKNPEVRKKLVNIQQQISKEYDIIMDGRDIGTCVLPNADYKFYLIADIKERAKRRLLENNIPLTDETIDNMIKEITLRDKNDSSRIYAPLKCADDAIVIDTTNLTQNQVIDKILSLISEK